MSASGDNESLAIGLIANLFGTRFGQYRFERLAGNLGLTDVQGKNKVEQIANVLKMYDNNKRALIINALINIHQLSSGDYADLEGMVQLLGLKLIGKKVVNAHTNTLPSNPISQGRDTRLNASNLRWDVFICHASEDKKEVADPLAQLLKELGLKVWYDKFNLRLGSRLLNSINEGLANSKYGVVILSKSFFERDWAPRELDGLYSLMIHQKRDLLLPIRHKISHEDLIRKAPMLSDILNRSTDIGIDALAREIFEIARA